MITVLHSAVQGLAEYGAASGNAAQPIGPHTGRVTAWVTGHLAVIAVVVAGLLLFWLLRAAYRR